tara:strand:- start:8949 stop:9392 length:444 start_codon:yes stop_codon:yes gene_type:complete
MAAGDSKLFNEYVLKERQGAYSQADALRVSFISDTYASVSADLATPNLSSVTATNGGNVAASYLLSSVAYTRATNVIKLDAADLPQILKDGSNPADVRCAVIYNDTSAADDLVQIYDMTADGTTALDLINNDFTFTFGAGGINTATV